MNDRNFDTPLFKTAMATIESRKEVGEVFRDNPQLKQHLLTDISANGVLLGTRSYGSVVELKHKETLCAGKKLHEALIESGNVGVDVLVQRYLQECELMTTLSHPNITRFLGLCFLSGTPLPLLVMERLERSLDNLLKHVPDISLDTKRSILISVCHGLDYLHKREPVIIHRDLTASNILLTSSSVAKIADMGNSRIADMRPDQMVMTFTCCPGTLVYIPPEALDVRHRYGPSLDIFSFGVIALYTMTQIFPGNLLQSTYYDPESKIQARTEVERRVEYFESLEKQYGSNHPVVITLVKKCLHNVPSERPTLEECTQFLRDVTTVEIVRSTCPCAPFTDKMGEFCCPKCYRYWSSIFAYDTIKQECYTCHTLTLPKRMIYYNNYKSH